MHKKVWVNISIINLCVVALLGLTLRSKILFALPGINYNHLLDSHSHFAFAGWVTIALLSLMVYELLPAENIRPVYNRLFAALAIVSWGMLFAYQADNKMPSDILSAIFIIITFVFGGVFIADIRRSAASKTVVLLAVSAIAYLILSSIGPITLGYLFAIKSRNAIYYRDALFTYLHLQYNGFFTLAVFSLLFHKLESHLTTKAKLYIKRFSLVLAISVLPALFMSYLWHDPNIYLRLIAIVGSCMVFIALILFVIASFSIIRMTQNTMPLVRYIMFISMCAFMLKMLLQSFTIFPLVGDQVFGNRPLIIGFLHLVFLGFVSLFILGYFMQTQVLNTNSILIKTGIIIFSSSVVLNEVILFLQGLGAMFIRSSYLIPWLLWGTSILLFIGAALIAIGKLKSRQSVLE